MKWSLLNIEEYVIEVVFVKDRKIVMSGAYFKNFKGNDNFLFAGNVNRGKKLTLTDCLRIKKNLFEIAEKNRNKFKEKDHEIKFRAIKVTTNKIKMKDPEIEFSFSIQNKKNYNFYL